MHSLACHTINSHIYHLLLPEQSYSRDHKSYRTDVALHRVFYILGPLPKAQSHQGTTSRQDTAGQRAPVMSWKYCQRGLVTFSPLKTLKHYNFLSNKHTQTRTPVCWLQVYLFIERLVIFRAWTEKLIPTDKLKIKKQPSAPQKKKQASDKPLVFHTALSSLYNTLHSKWPAN